MRALTEKQAAVMKLVADGYQTKEIARMLDLSIHTVNERIDAARRKLGGSTRAEAARLFVASHDIPERLGHEPIGLCQPTKTRRSAPPPQDELRFEDAMFDERAAWDRDSPWHLPRIAPRDLGKAGRLLVIVSLALLMMLIAGQALDLFREVGRSFPA